MKVKERDVCDGAFQNRFADEWRSEEGKQVVSVYKDEHISWK